MKHCNKKKITKYSNYFRSKIPYKKFFLKFLCNYKLRVFMISYNILHVYLNEYIWVVGKFWIYNFISFYEFFDRNYEFLYELYETFWIDLLIFLAFMSLFVHEFRVKLWVLWVIFLWFNELYENLRVYKFLWVIVLEFMSYI